MENTLFIAFCRVRESRYEAKSETYVKTHLVEAYCEGAAIEKVYAHYDKLYDSYVVSYQVEVLDISEVIK